MVLSPTPITHTHMSLFSRESPVIKLGTHHHGGSQETSLPGLPGIMWVAWCSFFLFLFIIMPNDGVSTCSSELSPDSANLTGHSVFLYSFVHWKKELPNTCSSGRESLRVALGKRLQCSGSFFTSCCSGHGILIIAFTLIWLHQQSLWSYL